MSIHAVDTLYAFLMLFCIKPVLLISSGSHEKFWFFRWATKGGARMSAGLIFGASSTARRAGHEPAWGGSAPLRARAKLGGRGSEGGLPPMFKLLGARVGFPRLLSCSGLRARRLGLPASQI